MDVERRLAALRERLRGSGADAFLISKVSNVVYVTGFGDVFDEHADAVCLITSDEATLFTGFIYARPAGLAALGTPWTVCEVRDGLYETVCDRLDEGGLRHVLLESSAPYGRFRYISERFGGRVEAVDRWVEEARTVKDDDEVARIGDAAALADAAFEHVLGFLRPGRTEREVALEIELHLRSHGSEGVPFTPIVASGPNSANPHAKVGDRVLAVGDLVKMDFGARVGGYCSDMTRTVVIGTAGKREREVYEAVRAANEAGIEAVRPGRRGSEIDAVARDLLTERGFGDEFGHGLGHGVGLDVHEAPRLGPRSNDPIPSGAVITIEPGVYVDGFGGVRIEDLLVVAEGFPRVLSGATKDLIEV